MRSKLQPSNCSLQIPNFIRHILREDKAEDRRQEVVDRTFLSGGKGNQAILTAVAARSGKIHWQERSIQKATFVWADQKLITLDQEGTLMIAHPSPQAFTIV